MEVVLASSSPRRQQILKDAGVKFIVDVSNANEDIDENLSPKEAAELLSKRKAEIVSKRHPNSFVIAADTIVSVNDELLGKPKSSKDAVKILNKLNGQRHFIVTVFTIISPQKSITDSDTTQVKFKNISEEEIKTYVKSGESKNKAGAYGIQGKADKFVEKVNGDIFNVVGFPVKIFDYFDNFGISYERRPQ